MSWAAFKKGRSILGAFSILVVGGIDALILPTSDIGIAAVGIAVVGIAVVGIAACTPADVLSRNIYNYVSYLGPGG
jgi:hypothetical protein